MVMEGLPSGLYLGTIVLAVVLSGIYFSLFVYRGKGGKGPEDYATYDLLQWPWLKRLVVWRPFQFVLQVPLVILFLVIIFAGLFGSQVPGQNLAPILTWTIWWVGLVFAIVILGKVWCLVCPWMAMADWLKRLAFWRKKEETLGLNLRWPQGMRNIYIATALFIMLTWLELGFGVTASPRATALLGILMLMMALVPTLIFDRKSFCRYACLVGRVSGLYALFAMSELRSRDKSICKSCRTKDCLLGNDLGYGCPTYEYLGKMELNTYCILCTECVKSCPHDNVAFNLRPFAVDLTKSKRARPDEAYLAIIMLSLALFHGLTMVTLWPELTRKLEATTSIGYLGSFTLAMVAIMALPGLLYYLFAWLSRWTSREPNISLRAVAIKYAYALLPVALLYHLAHNTGHLLREGQNLLPVLSDPFGWGWNLFGTAHWHIHEPVPMKIIWLAQIFLILAGLVYGLHTANRVSTHLFAAPGQRIRSQIPMTLLILAFTISGLWLLHLPMQMRTAM